MQSRFRLGVWRLFLNHGEGITRSRVAAKDSGVPCSFGPLVEAQGAEQVPRHLVFDEGDLERVDERHITAC